MVWLLPYIVFLLFAGRNYRNGPAKFIDGKATSVPVSNVARIGRATLLEDVENNIEQVVYYQTGLAARAELGLAQSLRDGGYGQGLVSNVREAYGFLCNNYDYGDEIFITGFSRGAFTARSVAAFILPNIELTPIKAGTTRKSLPDGTPITIKATKGMQGALSGDYSFHDVGIGKHIENRLHILSVNEKRAYYESALWENAQTNRPFKNFEQAWTVGDHSNVGGSWEDQQLADITLAWMMSRFEVVEIKFDQTYIYREYVKFNNFIKKRAPLLQSSGGSDEDPPYPKDAGLNPRTWGEGRSRTLEDDKLSGGGEKLRTPAMIRRPVLHPATWLASAYIAQDGEPLQNTNETFHPVVRYRHFSKNQDKLGAHDAGPYDPKNLTADWTWPAAQSDGRIGAPADKGVAAGADGVMKWQRKGYKGETITVTESPMGKFEKWLLALYDQDPVLQTRDGSVWKKVLGGNG
ncbi:MAG: hypothetical protein Q9191_000828 [Dirinaria sp. TL-2023a]